MKRECKQKVAAVFQRAGIKLPINAITSTTGYSGWLAWNVRALVDWCTMHRRRTAELITVSRHWTSCAALWCQYLLPISERTFTVTTQAAFLGSDCLQALQLRSDVVDKTCDKQKLMTCIRGHGASAVCRSLLLYRRHLELHRLLLFFVFWIFSPFLLFKI